MSLEKDTKNTSFKNLLQNVASLLLRPDNILAIEFNNEIYYIILESYFTKKGLHKSYIIDSYDMNKTFVNVHQIQDILSGNPTQRTDTLFGRYKDLFMTAEDFYKLRRLVNEKIG